MEVLGRYDYCSLLRSHLLVVNTRYDNVALSPLVLPLGLRFGPI
jgi:hypothetical protein